MLREVSRGVDHWSPLEFVEQRLAVGARARFELGDGLRRERGKEHPTGAVMERRVRRDRRRNTDGCKLERRTVVAHHHRPGREVLGVVGDLGHVVVTDGQPAAAVPVGVRDRAPLAEVVDDRVGVGGPLVGRVVEVRCPIRNRTGHDLVVDSHRFVVELVGEGRESLVDRLRASVLFGHVSPP